ncbi:hypothetical protein BCR32DRAFT_277662 [Anaeromyces robustus]|uniref:Uncharacterized protein n=1 Tax=Anaeromyces robustus TaxID=1754192 RepID=A0A1Y1XDJ6_9FUNG|nr:hypothetical protein BCR32DRAFT_277662 [Anaeromyces robustus]|eukprot:ORX83840.1 hypothetical protein BCR32DRAFT_277662 [Anaeromyces robustus]
MATTKKMIQLKKKWILLKKNDNESKITNNFLYNYLKYRIILNLMKEKNTINNYPFISQLSFEDPFNIIRTVLCGVEDNLSTISVKLITDDVQIVCLKK